MNKLLTAQRLLIVEDEMMLLMLLEDILTDLGCRSVSIAATVKQALALIDSQPFDVAILDVNLNGEKSFPIAEALAARHVPYIFATGYGIDAFPENYRDRPLLPKPYSFADVGNSLARLLSDARTEQALGRSEHI
ncbi:response regulator [Neorhizobium galegae]|uniref:response regulator n=1 Tax=Neorhizobium galegae TaxID=399 RepID=UPI001F4267E7|nr:response regulator [Neorhizobium galegae]UIK08861.1 response regulator [Neorhizobium galegae]